MATHHACWLPNMVSEFNSGTVPRKHQPGKVARWRGLLPGLAVDPQGYCLGRSAMGAPEPVEHLAHDYGLRWGSMYANGAGADCLEANRLALPDSPDWLEELGGSRCEHRQTRKGKAIGRRK
jgi:hypothetical protein